MTRLGLGTFACALLLLAPAAAQEAPPAELPAVYEARVGEERAKALKAEGGTAATEEAVAKALGWLARHQAPDGRWSANLWVQRCDDAARCEGPGWNTGDARYDVGLTALAMLAFQGAGSTHTWGEHQAVVQKALQFLFKSQADDGAVGYRRTAPESMYSHGLATTALCELAGMSRDPVVRAAAEKAVQFCADARNPQSGWKYGVRPGTSDTSVTAVFTVALVAARDAEIDVAPPVFDGARGWFRRCTDKQGNTGYSTPGGGSSFLPALDGKFDPVPTMSAAAAAARLGMGDNPADPELGPILEVVSRSLPAPGERLRNTYYWHWGTEAMFQAGGKRWERWRAALIAATVPTQRGVGECLRGSWDPIGDWCLVGGRVYETAMNALTLETFYRNPRRVVSKKDRRRGR